MKKVISTEKIPIKLWLDDIEEGALNQAKNLANLPFAFKHIAIMPDSHQGYGMPIGGVLATKGVIIPNAVGVDIGCFSGNTKVKLTDGRDLSFLELIEEYKLGKENYCYSINDDSNVVISKIKNPRKTRIAIKLLEIKLDSGEKIRCTEEHIFYTRQNKEIKASELKVGESLMPLYIKKAKEVDDIEYEHQFKKDKMSEYLVVYNPKNNKYRYVHILSDEFNLLNNIYKKSKGVRHHIDFDKYNNNPTNIKKLGWKEHWKVHYDNVGENSKKGIVGWKIARKNNPEFFSKMASDNMKNLHKRKDFQEIIKKNAIQNWINYSKTDKFKEQSKLAGQRGKKFLIAYNKSKKGRLKSSENGTKYGFGRKNHKVVSIKKIDTKENVYCLTVNKYHNFALSSGIFVHNCGMCAVKTSSTEIDTKTLKKIMGEIRRVIPVGFKKHNEMQDENLMPNPNNLLKDWKFNTFKKTYPIVFNEMFNALKSLGTLGGGNHFIEIQKGSDGYIWIMIHSGSRNIGFKIANYYNKLAIKLNEEWCVSVPKKWELAFLPIDSKEGQSYLREMQYAVDFALANRKLMMSKVQEIIYKETGAMNNPGEYKADMSGSFINIAHNYASLENHFGQNVWIHRKGATLAREDTIGIIPGSMGSKSYIVKGLGNKDSFESCSHGAGRKMGRKDAIRRLNLEEEQIKMEGIIGAPRSQNDLEEAPGAYKDISTVMSNQSDLVKTIVELYPLAVIKG